MAFLGESGHLRRAKLSKRRWPGWTTSGEAFRSKDLERRFVEGVHFRRETGHLGKPDAANGSVGTGWHEAKRRLGSGERGIEPYGAQRFPWVGYKATAPATARAALRQESRPIALFAQLGNSRNIGLYSSGKPGSSWSGDVFNALAIRSIVAYVGACFPTSRRQT